MALAKTSLPKVNRCNQRTHLQPRYLVGSNKVAWTAGRTADWGSNGNKTKGSAVAFVTNKNRLQEYLSAGLLNIAA